MSTRLKATLQELVKKSRDELIKHRELVTVERAKIDSKLSILAEMKSLDQEHLDLQRRTEFAYKASGITMGAIDYELSLRKYADRVTFHEAFYKEAIQGMPPSMLAMLEEKAKRYMEETNGTSDE